MRRRSGGTTAVADDRQRSPTQISPASGVRNPATRRSVVVLPQPDGPSSATSSRGFTSSRRLSTAATPPYRLVSPRSVTPGMARSSVLGAQEVPPERGLHQQHDAERHRQHEETKDGDGGELTFFLQVEDNDGDDLGGRCEQDDRRDRKSTRLNSSHLVMSYAVFCFKKKRSVNIHLSH